MNEERYWNLAGRYLVNELTEQETEELMQWLDNDLANRALFEEICEKWERTAGYPEDFAVNTSTAWTKVQQAIAKKEPEPVKMYTNPFRRWMSVAASMLLLLVAGLAMYYLYGKQDVLLATGTGESRMVTLPDSSKVWLNESSSLTYRKDFNDDSMRRVTLSGEAFFEVKRNPARRFVITTGNTLTQVLGTSFNVRQQKNGTVNVAVVTGKVSFGPGNRRLQHLVLLPGDKAECNTNGQLAKTSYSNTNFLYWKTHRLIFTDEPVGDVLSTLEGAYHVTFGVADSSMFKRKITTSFDHASIKQVTDVLRALLDVDIEQQGILYVVKKK